MIVFRDVQGIRAERTTSYSSLSGYSALGVRRGCRTPPGRDGVRALLLALRTAAGTSASSWYSLPKP